MRNQWFLVVVMMLALSGAMPGLTRAEGPYVPAEPVGPGLGIRLLEVPKKLVDDPRARSYIIDNVPPGTTISRRVEVTNKTGSPITVSLTPEAAHIDGSGFVFERMGAVNELTTWMSVDQKNLDIPDGHAMQFVVTIDVPKDAPEGEQYAVLWAAAGGGSGTGTGANVVSRVGVRTYLSVGPGNGPKADFTIDALTPRRTADGVAEVVASVSNTGGRAVDLGGDLKLSEGPAGLSGGPFRAGAKTLGPGASGEVVFKVDADLPDGPWKVSVELRSGLLTRHADVVLAFPERGVGERVETTSRTWPIVAVSVAGVIVAGAVLVFWLRRRSGQRSGAHRTP